MLYGSFSATPEGDMRKNLRIWVGAGLLATCGLVFANAALAQGGGVTPGSSPKLTTGRDTSPLTAENALEAINPVEESDFKAFEAISVEKLPKKIQAGENFLKKYTESRHRARVLSELTVFYIQEGQTEKALTAGANAVQLNPKDVWTMGILSQSLARMASANTPDAAQKLDQAEKYGKEAVETVPTLVKPPELPEQDFTARNNGALAMAYSGLGLVSLQRGKFSEAIPDLQQAVQLDQKKDPTNFYLLGVANQNSSHFAEAAAAFSKCAEFAGNLQATCKSAADEAKKHAASQPAAPK
jgi:tetratricopeptide (TPR) repeat protein